MARPDSWLKRDGVKRMVVAEFWLYAWDPEDEYYELFVRGTDPFGTEFWKKTEGGHHTPIVGLLESGAFEELKDDDAT